jgi:hypothetical protein
MRSGKSTQDSFSEHRCFSTDEVPVELESRTFHHGVSLTVVPFTWHLYRPEDIKFRRQFYAAANHPRSNEPIHSSTCSNRQKSEIAIEFALSYE